MLSTDGKKEPLKITKKMLSQKLGKENRKLKRSLEDRHTKHTETYLKYFDDHSCLSRSEESKCL